MESLKINVNKVLGLGIRDQQQVWKGEIRH